MIISGLIRKQLIAFAIASVVGILVLAVVFLRVPEALGLGRYTVNVQFSQGAGLYKGAQVNYLGTPVGKVRSMKLTDNGILVGLAIKNGTEIPRNSTAEIHSVSAVGEQYVELVPTTKPSAADLHQGDLITLDRTSVPVEIGPVLDNVAALVDSLPRKQLAQLLTETSTALQGRDQDLQTILDGSQSFLQAADASFPQTKALIRDADPLLTTVNGSAAHITSLTTKLAGVTDQLRAGDADLRSLLANGPGFADETTSFLQDIGPALPGFLAPLTAVTGVLSTYQDYVAQLLSDYPVALSFVQSVTLPERGGLDAVRLTLANANKPPECTQGFLPVSKWRAPDVVGNAYTPLYYCSSPSNDDRVVRGARNVPCPNDPTRRAATPAQCKENR
jgi:phospholipid/cholesterol/gamma-HCH transport system substrate-binding protein